MKKILSFILVLLVACSPGYKIEEHSDAGSKYVLPNGLTVLLKDNPNTGMVAIDVVIKKSIGVEGELHGISNFAHKALFSGTKSRTKEKIVQDIEQVGGIITPRTYVEFSEVTIEVPSTDLSVALDVLSDIIRNPSFDPDAVEKERDLVIQELRSKLDQPPVVAEELFMRTLYRDHPYQHPPDGYVEHVEQITREQLIEHYNNWYTPDHIVIAIAGNIDKTTTMHAIRELFGGMEASEANDPTGSPQQLHSPRTEKEHFIAESYFIQSGYLTVPASDPDFIPIRVLAGIMGYGSGSRLFYELRDQRALAYSVYVGMPSVRNIGFYKTVMTVRPEALNASINGIKREEQRIKTELVDEEELRHVKNKIKGFFFLDHQKSKDQANYLAIYEAQGLGYEMDVLYPELIEEVTPGEVQYVANEYLRNPATAIVGPFETGSAIQ